MAQKLTTTPDDGDYQDIIASEAEVGSTATEDMFDGPKTVYSITLDNSSNSQVVYYRLYNLLTADPSSDVANMKFKVAASKSTTIIISDGVTFSTGVTLRCTSNSDDTNTTNPSTVGPAYILGS